MACIVRRVWHDMTWHECGVGATFEGGARFKYLADRASSFTSSTGHKLQGNQVQPATQARDLKKLIPEGGLVLAVRDCMLLLLIDMEVDQRARFVSRYLIRAVALSVVLDAMKTVADRYCSLYWYTLYLLRKGGGRKWAVLQHRRCIGYLCCFYLVASGLIHFLYYSILLCTYFLVW